MTQIKATRWVPIVLAFAVLSVLALPAVGTAHADTNSFLREAHAKAETPITDAQALQLGKVACGKLRKGADGQTIPASRADSDKAVGWEARRLGISGGEGLDRATIMWLTEAAEHELC